jgi:signal recognition particle subunit SEC65
MKNVALYPFNKISQGLIRFRDLLDFNIKSVIDFSLNIGEDVGKVISGNPIGIYVVDDIEKALEDVDTLILNDGGAPIHHFADIYSKYNLQERWKEVLSKATDLGIKIVSTHEITNPDLSRWIKDNNIVLHTYTKTKEQVLEYIENTKKIETTSESKKIGIYGTRSCIGKFTAQMYLLRALKKKGCKASALITEPTAELFHQYDVDPIRFLEILPDPIKYNQYTKALATNCTNNGDEYIIMASQQGLAYNGKDNIYGNLIRLSNMVEYDPDVILLIVGYDDDDAIKDCLELIRIYCEGKKPLAFLLPDKIEVGYGQYEEKTMEDIQKRKEQLMEKFDVRMVESIKCIENIINIIGK